MPYVDKDALMKDLEREVGLADDWEAAYEIANVVKYFPTADVVDKERYVRLLENSFIIAKALRKYQTADVSERNVGDMISRQAAIDVAHKVIKRDKSGNNDVVKAMQAWVKYIEELPSAQAWIPVTERLPKPNEHIGNVRRYYLVQNEYGDMFVASYDGEWEQIYRHEYYLDKIVAWMPLPKPFRKETKDADY